MTLVRRITNFFLITLAVVLAAFSGALYTLAAIYLNREIDSRVDAALVALTASCEVDEKGVEWEPTERVLELGLGDELTEVRWTVHDGQGVLVDRSQNLDAEHFLTSSTSGLPDIGKYRHDDAGHRWNIATRRLEAPPGVIGPFGPNGYDALVLTVAASMEPTYATLRHLAITVVLLSLATWIFSALFGSTLVRRALEPLARMSARVESMGVRALEQRLAVPERRDEVQTLARSFNGLLNRLQEAFERLGRFTGDASHQLRTPLTSMIGQLEVALRRERSAEEYQSILRRVLGQATLLRRILESLLFLARSDKEADLPDMEPIQVSRWLAEHLTRWSDHARASDIHFAGPADGESCWIVAHPALLAQLLDNLVDNALKYSDPGSDVMLSVAAEEQSVKILVADNGLGIPAEDIERIFEPFYRSEQARRTGRSGAGLGLSVARRIAEALGGTLTACKASVKGAEFTITLPRSPALGTPQYGEQQREAAVRC